MRGRMSNETCRLSAANQGKDTPAKPKALFPSIIATMTAISREIAHVSVPVPVANRIRWTSPPLFRILLVLGELVVVLVLCFYKLNPRDQWQWENIGYRTGFIATAQLPLIFLLAGKNNIIGFLIGSSYERLNWLHRWASRILWLTVTIHMGFWFTSWARYDYIRVKLYTDNMTQTGFASWCILTWIVFSSIAPTRRWNYELFVVQHLISFVGFIPAVYLHVPDEVRVWLWISIGLFIMDRCARALTLAYANLSIFHPKSNTNGFWACRATFEPLASDATRIVISNPPIQWTVGQYMHISCHGIAPLQSHPFTVASIPQDGRMEFLVKSKAGGTKRFFKHAKNHRMLCSTSGAPMSSYIRTVTIEGPYGRMRPLRQFDSVIMFAGSSGGTFTVPLMRDIVSAWKSPHSNGLSPFQTLAPIGAVTRYIRFIWVVKSRQQYSWFSPQLTVVAQDAENLRKEGLEIEVEMSIYVTCDDSLEADDQAPRPKTVDPEHGEPKAADNKKIPILFDEKFEDRSEADTLSTHSTSSQLEHRSSLYTTCGPDGTCCCRTTIEDEDVISPPAASCQCNCTTLTASAGFSTTMPPLSTNKNIQSTPSLPALEKPTTIPTLPPGISMRSGRPQPRTLIRKTLEQAAGESAVVVCGPPGLVENVRKAVVGLSDERAVHKGTGAQGVYLHAESFEY